MSVLEYLAKVDFAAVQFEKAKREMENAKLSFERSKQAYDEALAQAEALGLSKAKLKRVAEDRVASLIESGLIDIGKEVSASSKKVVTDVKSEKVSKAKRKTRSDESEELSAEVDFDEPNNENNFFNANESIEGNA
ncbi:MAG: hypothetical protein ACXVCY_11435 [Pseudobdellovibrionaceae bacterium]